MKPKLADTVVGLLVVSILLVGGIATWQAYQQWIALEGMGDHMGTSMTAMHGTHPVWYLLGTLFIAIVTIGMYIGVRDRIVSPVDKPAQRAPIDETSGTTEPDAVTTEPEAVTNDPGTTEHAAQRQVLDLLPDDETRILEPVLDSPGLTQIELRDRSNFSKSKVSQTVSDLEKRGLLYREPQGRTYRIYPAKDLKEHS